MNAEASLEQPPDNRSQDGSSVENAGQPDPAAKPPVLTPEQYFATLVTVTSNVAAINLTVEREARRTADRVLNQVKTHVKNPIIVDEAKRRIEGALKRLREFRAEQIEKQLAGLLERAAGFGQPISAGQPAETKISDAPPDGSAA